MARNSFAINTLDGASSGLSRLAQAIGGAGQTEQGAYDQQLQLRSRIAQEMAAAQASTSAAKAHDALAAEATAKTGVLAKRPDLYNTQVANLAGVDVPTVNGYLEQLQTGKAPIVPMGPPTEDGTMGAGSMVLSEPVKSKLAGAIQQFLPLLANSGDLKPDDLAGAAKTFRDMGLGDAIINGSANRNTVAGSQAAVAGKPLFNTSADGAVLDQYGGGLDTNNPLARSTISLRGAQAGEASARGRLATAQAGEVGAPKFDSASGTVVDARTATARPVMGTDGKPIGGRGGTLNQEQANALGFGSRMQASDKILSELASQGVMRPGGIYSTASALPFGEQLTNWTQTDQQQQVEQAQRDFINAVLRRESGAAISTGEFSNAAKQYFPQSGDGRAVIAQKAAARQRVIQGMLAAVPPGQRELPALPGAAPGASPAMPPSTPQLLKPMTGRPGSGKTIAVDY